LFDYTNAQVLMTGNVILVSSVTNHSKAAINYIVISERKS